jgi:tetratricopeptide (TPR) repeat protein
VVTRDKSISVTALRKFSTTDLSKIASLFVITRNSAFTYKGKAVKVQEVGKEMGVQYVLEGSVLRADGQVRITAQLISATTGYHLWSERYDRPLKDIFAIQDEIVQKIVTTLKLQIPLMEQGYLVRKRTDNLEAYDAFLHGKEGIGMIKQAMRLNPRYPITYLHDLGWAYRVVGRCEEAIVPLKKLLTLKPDFLPSHINLASCYAELDRLGEAQAEAAEILRIMPNWSLEGARRYWPYKDPADLERHLAALQKAGLK